jgi:hypothetical protein
MSQAFFYKTNDRRTFGPFSTQELKGEAVQGRLNPDDTVWIDGANKIYKAKLIKGLFDGADSPRVTSAEPPAVNISPAQDTTADAPVINVDPTPQVAPLEAPAINVNSIMEAAPSSTSPPLPIQTKEWFYSKEGQQLGPYSEQEVVTLLGKDIDGQTLLVWKAGMEEWVKSATVLPLVNQTSFDGPNQIVTPRSKQESAGSQRIIIYSILGLVVFVVGVFGIIATTTDLIFAPSNYNTPSTNSIGSSHNISVEEEIQSRMENAHESKLKYPASASWSGFFITKVTSFPSTSVSFFHDYPENGGYYCFATCRAMNGLGQIVPSHIMGFFDSQGNLLHVQATDRFVELLGTKELIPYGNWEELSRK